MTAVVPGAPERQELTAVVMALRPLLPEPPPGRGAGGPFALSQEGALEALFEEAGLQIVDTDELDTPIEFPDEATMLRGMLAAGPAVMAAHHAGEDAVRQATLQSMAPFRRASGGYRLENTAIYVIGVSQ